MLHHQTFPARGHDIFHPFAHIICCSRFKIYDKFDATLNFFDTCFEIALAEFGRLIDQRLAIEIQKVKYFDCSTG